MKMKIYKVLVQRTNAVGKWVQEIGPLTKEFYSKEAAKEYAKHTIETARKLNDGTETKVFITSYKVKVLEDKSAWLR